MIIPKPGEDISKIENQRFFTLLPVGKVYERLVKKRLNWEVEKRNILKDVQSGFRRSENTIDNLVYFQSDAVLLYKMDFSSLTYSNFQFQSAKSRKLICFQCCQIGRK